MPTRLALMMYPNIAPVDIAAIGGFLARIRADRSSSARSDAKKLNAPQALASNLSARHSRMSSIELLEFPRIRKNNRSDSGDGASIAVLSARASMAVALGIVEGKGSEVSRPIAASERPTSSSETMLDTLSINLSTSAGVKVSARNRAWRGSPTASCFVFANRTSLTSMLLGRRPRTFGAGATQAATIRHPGIPTTTPNPACDHRNRRPFSFRTIAACQAHSGQHRG